MPGQKCRSFADVWIKLFAPDKKLFQKSISAPHSNKHCKREQKCTPAFIKSRYVFRLKKVSQTQKDLKKDRIQKNVASLEHS